MASHAVIPPPPSSSSGNRLLVALSPAALALVEPALELVQLRHAQVLYEPGEAIVYVHFPLNAVLSQLTLLADGEAVETGIIGNEGFVGRPIFFGLDSNHSRLI